MSETIENNRSIPENSEIEKKRDDRLEYTHHGLLREILKDGYLMVVTHTIHSILIITKDILKNIIINCILVFIVIKP